eukprot:7196938-Lingulodinium_polyedra.AAC.1
MFDSASKVAALLSQHKVFADRVVRVDNVMGSDVDVPRTIYVVLTGAGRYLKHYLGIRRGGANVHISVNVGAGAND